MKNLDKLNKIEADALFIINSAVAINGGVINFNTDNENIPVLYMDTMYTDNEECVPCKIQNGNIFYREIEDDQRQQMENIPFDELDIYQLCNIADYIEYYRWNVLEQKLSID